MPVVNALFERILQCVSRYTATHLVLVIGIMRGAVYLTLLPYKLPIARFFVAVDFSAMLLGNFTPPPKKKKHCPRQEDGDATTQA